jgi:putative transposase
MFAAAVSASGYITMPLTSEDYLELLPVEWRCITDQGIQIDYRHYDCRELNVYRNQTSGVVGKNGRWEVHYDPLRPEPCLGPQPS